LHVGEPHALRIEGDGKRTRRERRPHGGRVDACDRRRALLDLRAGRLRRRAVEAEERHRAPRAEGAADRGVVVDRRDLVLGADATSSCCSLKNNPKKGRLGNPPH